MFPLLHFFAAFSLFTFFSQIPGPGKVPQNVTQTMIKGFINETFLPCNITFWGTFGEVLVTCRRT